MKMSGMFGVGAVLSLVALILLGIVYGIIAFALTSLFFGEQAEKKTWEKPNKELFKKVAPWLWLAFVGFLYYTLFGAAVEGGMMMIPIILLAVVVGVGTAALLGGKP